MPVRFSSVAMSVVKMSADSIVKMSGGKLIPKMSMDFGMSALKISSY